MIQVKEGDRVERKRNWWDRFFRRRWILNVVKDENGELWLQDCGLWDKAVPKKGLDETRYSKQ